MAIEKGLLIHWWHYYGKGIYTFAELEEFEEIIDEYGTERVLDAAVASYVCGDGSPTIILASIRKGVVKELFESLPDASTLRVPFIIEKQFNGKEYRVFLTKEEKYAVLHREPAHVVGDGEHSILQLIEIENEKRKARTNCLCLIAIDEITESYMTKNNIFMEDIPKENEKVYLRHNSNVAKGGLCIDYTDKVHKSVIENCKKILKVFSGLSYVGIDYMSKDIEVEQTANMYNIVEVNTVPGIHMHMRPSEGKPRNVAKYMVDMIFPETKEQEPEQP